MSNSATRKGSRRQSGYALLSTLILLFILTAIAIGMFYSSLSERNNATADMEHNKAFYGAEAAMEKMTADLGTLYQNEKSPSIADIDGITTASHYPVVPDVNFKEYAIQVPASPANPTMPDGIVQTISSGPNAGLYAQVIRITLSATAETAGGAGANGSIAGLEQVRMTRNAEVALIPVFQFGIFCQNDCDFFNGPPFDFGGRTFANGNIFLATGQGLTFHSKVQAVQQIVRNALENGEDSTTNWNGKVDVPTAPNGCDGAQPACRQLQSNEESTHGFFGAKGQPNPKPPKNPNWPAISNQTYAGMLQNGDTGVRPLNLAFVQPGVTPYEIIRRPYPSTEPVTSSTGSSRLYNQAQIRILLDDDPLRLPGGPQPDDRKLDFYPNYPAPQLPPPGVQDPQLGPAAVTGPGLLTQSMAQGIQLAQPTDGKGHCIDAKNNIVKCAGFDAAWVNRIAGQPFNTAWPLISGWLRVEYRDAAGQYHNITQEWLNLGFARQGQVSGPTPNSEAGIANTIHPNAILLFQFPADQFVPNAAHQFNWNPINMYDPREGEVRDNAGATATDCAVGGLLNVIELDMNNLRLWLNGTIPGSGALVESRSQNGYIVYFSDRRGMQLDPLSPFPTELDGEYGFNDVVNIANANGAPNGLPDAGEDVDGDGRVHTAGTANIGVGFGLPVAAAKNPYTGIGTGRIANCATTGRVNQVTGPRHAIRVVNGSLGNVPLTPAGTGGTTIAGENPVYVLGNYNASNAGFGDVAEAGSAVIADALTLLSNNYTDLNALSNPTTRTARLAGTTWYRLAVAAGKNPPFPAPAVAGFGYGPNPTDFGTDGGIHNFLRYIEDWGGQTLNYEGSLVSFYYSRQAVGVFKCCNVVYAPPSRNYNFDTKFLDPANLPPGTPRFQDIDNLGYHQDFRPQ